MASFNNLKVSELVYLAEKRFNESVPSIPEIPLPPGVPAGEYLGAVPTGPPPGLDQVRSTKPSSPRIINDSPLFGHFAPYLDKGLDENGCPVIVDLTCGICQDHKLIPSRATLSSARFNFGETEWLSVLPCGHFFGSKCLARWLDHLEDNGVCPTCPLCRFELAYDCGHNIPPREYNPLLARKEHMPMTIPEGGSLPSLCEDCFDWEIESMVDLLRHLVPSHIVPEDFKTEIAGDIVATSFIWLKDRIEDCRKVKEHYNS
ncbi:hypothetical protein F4861DRAFT_8575 [Xylaria intraflava]|nr:hypothetical protein F4861DRAFT_8575 [Xylaria intraflava]